MIHAFQQHEDREPKGKSPGDVRGFSMIELLIVMLIGTILTVMAIPQVTTGVNRYRLQGAIASSTWAIQSTRYQALMEGYQFQVVFTKSDNSYQIQSKPTGAASFSNVGGLVPLSGSAIALDADTTLQFRPNGFVQNTVGNLHFAITYQGFCQKVTVSNYANISLTDIVPVGGSTCP